MTSLAGNDAPMLSVVMPVRNAAAYLDAAIGSIVNQTLSDFEFVVLDDASTDGSTAILRRWAARDRRIRLVESAAALGPAGSADRVVREARGAICARMDADDVSHPDRLRAELEVLTRHPAVSLVGTLWEGIDRKGRRVRPRDRWGLFHPSVFAPFPHGSIMFRRDQFLGLGGYRPLCEFWEDFDFYLRMEQLGPVMVIANALYLYRFHGGATTSQYGQDQLMAVDLMYRCADRAAAGEDYTALLGLRGMTNRRPAARVDPRAIRSFGSRRLWSGEKPDLFLRDLRRMNGPALSPAALHAWVLAMWGEISPRSLRWMLRARIRVRDAAASRRIPVGAVVQWLPRAREAVTAKSP